MFRVPGACLVVFPLATCSSGLDCSKGFCRASLLLGSGLLGLWVSYLLGSSRCSRNSWDSRLDRWLFYSTGLDPSLSKVQLNRAPLLLRE